MSDVGLDCGETFVSEPWAIAMPVRNVDERLDADDLLTVATAIVSGVYPTHQITPNIRAMARHYIELRAEIARLRAADRTIP